MSLVIFHAQESICEAALHCFPTRTHGWSQAVNGHMAVGLTLHIDLVQKI